MALASDDSPYWLHSAKEIAFTLNELRKSRLALTAHVAQSGSQFISAILEVDAGKGLIYFDAPPQRMQQASVNGSDVALRGTVDGVRVEFLARGATLTQIDGAPAVQAKLPDRVLKIQRRAYFRIAIPFSRPVTCLVPRRGSLALHCQVLDIGLGGIALSADEKDDALAEDTVFERCMIDLHDAGKLEARLRVLHASLIRRNDKPGIRRYGCEFVELKSAQETLIQRFVLQLERERRAATDAH